MSEVYRFTKVTVAVDQLDWSIRLLLDHKAYVPAIALAGAADEVLGKLAGPKASIFRLQNILGKDGLDRKQAADLLNYFRNWIKHCNTADMGDTYLDYAKPAIESAAILMIIRALINLERLEQAGSSEQPRFNQWLHRTRPDLTNCK